MEGSNGVLITHPPSDNDPHECQNILLPDEFDLDPSKNFFEMSSMEEEYRTSSNFHLYINIVESRVPCAHPTIQCRDDSGIHEFDRVMVHVFIGVAQDLMIKNYLSML